MIELKPSQFSSVRRFASESDGEAEYYNAIIDGRQHGRIFADNASNPSSVLFWHYCGYGFVGGKPNNDFWQEVQSMVLRENEFFTSDTSLQSRFILQQNDDSSDRIFENDKRLIHSERLCFDFLGDVKEVDLPQGFSLCEISAEVLKKMQGDVTPSFSWKSDEEFLRGGVGVCVMRGDEPVAWSIASAIGGGRMDIGVETVSEYRGRGFAKAAATGMLQIAKKMNLLPVWGCDASNPASAKTALAIGFTPSGTHSKFKKKI